MDKKFKKLADLVKIRNQLKHQDKKVVFTNGCFDLLHSGHIHLFREARKKGDVFLRGDSAENHSPASS
jgi:D-beta-D-heptose 7-phosphate kinase/D-beta-D-heptose 1-phosphate adenosyltransferase